MDMLSATIYSIQLIYRIYWMVARPGFCLNTPSAGMFANVCVVVSVYVRYLDTAPEFRLMIDRTHILAGPVSFRNYYYVIDVISIASYDKRMC